MTIRERLVVSCGTLFIFVGLFVGGIALNWLLGPYAGDPDGAFQKYFVLARFGAVVGAIALLGGLALVLAGVTAWRRHPRPLTRRLTLERTIVDRSIYLGIMIAMIGVGIALAAWLMVVVGGIGGALAATRLVLAAMILRRTPAADLDQNFDYIRPTLRWKPRGSSTSPDGIESAESASSRLPD